MKRIALLMAAAAVACITAHAQKGTKTLVAYFSATGTTEKVARQIATATEGTLYKIQPAKAYTSADLNWRNKSSRSSVEMADDKSRPALSGSLKNPTEYDVIYIGFPIWWDLAPRVINTFIESYRFAGKTVIPFATSGGSGISNSEKELQKAYPEIKWKKGKLLNSPTQNEIKKWINQ